MIGARLLAEIKYSGGMEPPPPLPIHPSHMNLFIFFFVNIPRATTTPPGFGGSLALVGQWAEIHPPPHGDSGLIQ